MENMIKFTHSLTNITQNINATYQPKDLQKIKSVNIPEAPKRKLHKKEILIATPPTTKQTIEENTIAGQIKTETQTLIENNKYISKKFVIDAYNKLNVPIDLKSTPKQLLESLKILLGI